MRTSLALCFLVFAGCRTVGPEALEEESVRLELGRQVVATLDKQDHYFEEPGKREAFERRLERIARRTRDADGYYRGLSDALATLNEGHTGLVSSASVRFSDTIPPVAILELPEGFVVAGIAPGVESSLLRPGDLILKVGERPVDEVIAERMGQTSGSTPHGRRARAVAHLLAGPIDDCPHVHVEDVEGRVRIRYPLRFLLDDEGRYRQRFGFLPEELRAQRLDEDTGYIALPDFEPRRAEEFFAALEPFADARRLVLDLRGNPGGRIQTLQRIAGAFFDEETELLLMRQGDKEETVYSLPAPLRYDGSVVVLVDARTGSAAELFAAALQDRREAVLVGEATAGSVGDVHVPAPPAGVPRVDAGRGADRRRTPHPVLERRQRTPPGDRDDDRDRRPALEGAVHPHPPRHDGLPDAPRPSGAAQERARRRQPQLCGRNAVPPARDRRPKPTERRRFSRPAPARHPASTRASM